VTAKAQTGPVDWDEYARLAMGVWGIPPSEYRNMTPAEFWLIYDAKARQIEAAGGPVGPPTLDEIVLFERGIVERRRGHDA